MATNDRNNSRRSEPLKASAPVADSVPTPIPETAPEPVPVTTEPPMPTPTPVTIRLKNKLATTLRISLHAVDAKPGDPVIMVPLAGYSVGAPFQEGQITSYTHGLIEQGHLQVVR